MGSFATALADRTVLLDGGLATRLEARGHDLSDTLWSARLLLTDPGEIRATHEDFFAAGAEVATTASYQVSESGFEAAGYTAAEARQALRRSVRLAREASEAFGGPRWVAASVGPYGATLADGSEYRGDYGLSVDELRAWHRPRLEILAETGADVLACETIPSLAETEALAAELTALGVPAWLSLTTVGDRTRRDEPASEAFAIAAEVPNMVALGANCCDPADGRHHSGEDWDAHARHWTGHAAVGDSARSWADAGVRALGGCCRVTPYQIAGMRTELDRR